MEHLDRRSHKRSNNSAFHNPELLLDSPETTQSLRLNVPLWIITLGMLVIIAAAFWGSMGLHTVPLVEDWSFYSSFDAGGISPATLFTQIQPDRPFLALVYAIGYVLTPNSFVGLQILGLLTFIGSGFALFGIVRQLLPKVPVIAFMSALLYVIYPAETGWFNSRYYSYTLTVLLFEAAVFLLLTYWQRPRRWLIPIMWALLFVCLGTYETAYPLIFAAPFLLIWLHKGLSRRMIRVVAFWYLVPIAMLIFTVYVLATTAGTYQASLLSAGADTPATRVLTYLSYAIHAYQQVFWSGWADILFRLRLHAITYFTAASFLIIPVALLGLLVTAVLSKQTPSLQPTTAATGTSRLRQFIDPGFQFILLFLIGLATVGLGFLMYIPIAGRRDLTDRVYLFPSIGGAICVSILLYGIASLARRWKMLVLAVLFVFIWSVEGVSAMGRAVGLHYDSSQDQLSLAQIAEQMPTIARRSIIVIFDPTDTLRTPVWRFGTTWYNTHLQAALQYLYQRPELQTWLCYPGRGFWGSLNQQCVMGSDSIHVNINQFPAALPYSHIIAFDYLPETGFKLLSKLPAIYQTADNAKAFQTYNPEALINRALPPPARVYTALSDWPYVPFMPHSLFPLRSIEISMSAVNHAPSEEVFQNPLLTDGWSLDSWTTATTASAHLLLAQGNDYFLKFHILTSITPDVLDGLTFTVNGQPIDLNQFDDPVDGVVFTGIIPHHAIDINPTDTLIEFHTNKVIAPAEAGMGSDTRTLGVNVDWIHIDPLALTPQSSISLSAPNFDLPHSGLPSQYPRYSAQWGGGWTTATTASFYVLLPPVGDYHLSFHVANSLVPEVLDSLTFSVNGQLISLTRTNDPGGGPGATFTGGIPHAVIALNATNTLIEFHTSKVISPKSVGLNGDTRLLGVNVDALHIDPASSATVTP